LNYKRDDLWFFYKSNLSKVIEKYKQKKVRSKNDYDYKKKTFYPHRQMKNLSCHRGSQEVHSNTTLKTIIVSLPNEHLLIVNTSHIDLKIPIALHGTHKILQGR
jgi:hypothetical protein